MMKTRRAAGEQMGSNHEGDRRWMLLFVAAGLLLVAPHRHFSGQSAGLKPMDDRKPAADLTLAQLGGGVWKLGDHHGQVVLINYWATWCEPCRDELPGIEEVARGSAAHGLAVVGISMDTAPDAATRAQQVQHFVSRYRVPYPIAFPNDSLEMEPGDGALPTTVLIDRKGRAAKTYVGEVEWKILDEDVAALLAES